MGRPDNLVAGKGEHRAGHHQERFREQGLCGTDEIRSKSLFSAQAIAIARAPRILIAGVKFVLPEQLSIAEISVEEAKVIDWMLESMFARPVAQKRDGTTDYDVMTRTCCRCPVAVCDRARAM